MTAHPIGRRAILLVALVLSGSLPVAVIDARGQGRLIFVFAANPTGVAWECRAPLGAQTAAP